MNSASRSVIAIIAGTVFALSGCGSKIYKHPSLVKNPSEPSADLYVFREDVVQGSGRATPVYLDEKKILQLRRGRYARVHLKPGNYQLKAGRKTSRCGGKSICWTYCPNSMSFDEGKTYYVLLTFFNSDRDQCFMPGLIPEKDAKSLMATYRPVH